MSQVPSTDSTTLLISALSEELRRRKLDEGGFRHTSDAMGFRPDSTSWAIVALVPTGLELGTSRDRLVELQASDGSVRLSLDTPRAVWPTSLAILAFKSSPKHTEPRSRAVEYLRTFTGIHFDRPENFPLAHDTGLRGWPWVQGTHSWVEPTALAIVALSTTSARHDPRVVEATAMLLDRQLEVGGWNYGNTAVFGSPLRPFPDSTGLALAALQEVTPLEKVVRSLDYLGEQIASVRAPLSLCWGNLALAAWDRKNPNLAEQIAASLDRYGPVQSLSTTQVALMLITLQAPSGLKNYLESI